MMNNTIPCFKKYSKKKFHKKPPKNEIDENFSFTKFME